MLRGTARSGGQHEATKATEARTQDPLRRLGLLDDEDVLTMMKGSSMVKVRSPRWQKSRRLRLLEDGVTVWCESSKSFRRTKAEQTCTLWTSAWGFEWIASLCLLCVPRHHPGDFGLSLMK